MNSIVDRGYEMRKPCHKCGCPEGRIEERGAQDVVRCAECDAYCYCAPRSETGKPQRTVRSRKDISPKQRARILINRAGARCELCGKPGNGGLEPLHVGHLISVDSGKEMGMTDEDLNSDENLAAMCSECNLGLGSQPVPLRLMMSLLMARLKLSKGAKSK